MSHIACKHFAAGSCAHGANCAFGHQPAAPAENTGSKRAQKRANSLAKKKAAEAEVAQAAAAKAKAEADAAKAAVAKAKPKAKPN